MQGLSQAIVRANQLCIEGDGLAILNLGSFRSLQLEITSCQLEVGGGLAWIASRCLAEKRFGFR